MNKLGHLNFCYRKLNPQCCCARLPLNVRKYDRFSLIQNNARFSTNNYAQKFQNGLGFETYSISTLTWANSKCKRVQE